MNVMRRMMMTSNAGKTDQAEFSPFPPPQTGALPSHHHLLFMITIYGLIMMQRMRIKYLVFFSTCWRSSSCRCTSFTELLLLLTQPSSSRLLRVPSSSLLLNVLSPSCLLTAPSFSQPIPNRYLWSTLIKKIDTIHA